MAPPIYRDPNVEQSEGEEEGELVSFIEGDSHVVNDFDDGVGVEFATAEELIRFYETVSSKGVYSKYSIENYVLKLRRCFSRI